jgi:hypothetical protein
MSTWLITNTFFTNLINRLGIRPPPNQGFNIQDTVVPVSIVDADITVPVAPTGVTLDVGNRFSQGPVATPAANTLLADTGPQPAGNYLLTILIGGEGDNVQPGFVLARRNAANAADVWASLIAQGQNNNFIFMTVRCVLSLNERMIIRLGPNNAGNGNATQATIFLSPN